MISSSRSCRWRRVEIDWLYETRPDQPAYRPCFSPMKTISVSLVFALAAAALPLLGFSAPETPPVVKNPPRTWIDPETGHRVIRITDDPNTESLYFNDNCFTPDGKEMIFTTAEGGISVLDLATWKNRPVVKERVRLI